MNKKTLRLHRLFHEESDRSILMPIDHGPTMGAIQGLKDIPALVSLAAKYDFQGVVAHKGVIQWAVESGKEAQSTDYLLHISASTSLSNQQLFKQTVSTIQHALSIGVTGISMHINLGTPHEGEMLKELGRVSDEAYKWGLPLLTMLNVFEASGEISTSSKKLAHAVRIAGELGSDLVKIPMCQSVEDTSELVQGFPIPVLLAGGEQQQEKIEFFKYIEKALTYGIKGLCVGRNVFEDKNPKAMCKALQAIVHEKYTAEEALLVYNQHSVLELHAI